MPDNKQVTYPNGWDSSAHAPGKMGELQDCLAAAGWEVVFNDGDGTLDGPTLPKEQMPLYDADHARCAEETHFFDPMTTEDYHQLYTLEMVNHQCLIDHGFESADPPSEQQFVDDWLARSPDREPYQAISRVFYEGSDADYRAAARACPPPLWGF